MLLLAETKKMSHNKKRRRGSMPGRQVVPRDIHAGNSRIVADYFADPPIYNDKFFWRRFRMSKPFFLESFKELRHMMTISGKGQMQWGCLEQLPFRKWLELLGC